LIHIFKRKGEITPSQKYSFKMLLNEIFGKESEYIKVMIPAILYLIQNNLNYYAASKLDAATYQITYQIKIITTAFFSIIILKRRLFKQHWISLFILFIGIALVQLPTGDNNKNNNKNTEFDKIIGVITIILGCLLSGLSGVYFEKILKKSKVTIWARNVQLSLFSIILGYIVGVLFFDGEIVKKKGFFTGYTPWTILTIIAQAFHGILIAIVVIYADNILKGFATSISIILSCIISYYVLNFNITIIFTVGCALVIYATYVYSKPIKIENNDIKCIKNIEE